MTRSSFATTLAVIPEVDAKTWKISVGGDGANGQAQLTLDDLQGNASKPRLSRSTNAPAIAAACSSRTCPASNGATAPWAAPAGEGARLKDVLDKVGLKKEAIEIVFDGADGPVVDKTPDFVKSIPVWKALEDTTLIAYEMNGAAAAALQRLSRRAWWCPAGPAPTG